MKRDTQFDALRQRAQERLPPPELDVPLAPDASPQRMLHELRVYQVELEMQNEHLAASRAWVEAALASYRELYDDAPVACFTFDRNGAIVEMNLAAARLLGAERGLLLDQRFGPFLTEDSRRSFNAALSRIFAGRPGPACDLTLPAARTLQMEAVCTGDGQHCRAVMIDVSARAAREARAAHLASIFEQSDEALLITDAGGIVIDANGAFGALCGQAPERLAGQDARALRVPGPADAAMWRALALDGNWSGRSAYRHRSGAEVEVAERVAAVRGESGEVLYFVSRLRHER